MAQKRMFDKSILDTDNFMDLPITAKALYFLLGMEADDEGFVSYKKVLRIHGGTEDDVKILLAKKFLINFPSGVVVITHWNKNNWLDSRRSRTTEYQLEKGQLSLTKEDMYVLSKGLAGNENNGLTTTLSHCLATAKPEESSIEENRIEENRIEERVMSAQKAPTPSPSEISKSFFSKGKFYEEYIVLFTNNGNDQFIKKEFDRFILYWTEPNKSGSKVRWEQQSTFEIKRRLTTWMGRTDNFISRRETKII